MSNSPENSRAIVQQVRQILAERGQASEAGHSGPADASTLDRHLQQVTLASQTLPTAPDLAASPATRLPLIGPLWASLRRQAHQLTLFYVNRAAGHQIGVNHELQGAITQLRTLVAAQEKRIASLEQQLEQHKREQN